jgi:hypothetical protein
MTTTDIPSEFTNPELTKDEINFLRLQWRAEKAPDLTSVVKCEHSTLPHPPEGPERYHVAINGRESLGHWKYDAAWYLIVGAQMAVRPSVFSAGRLQ